MMGHGSSMRSNQFADIGVQLQRQSAKQNIMNAFETCSRMVFHPPTPQPVCVVPLPQDAKKSHHILDDLVSVFAGQLPCGSLLPDRKHLIDKIATFIVGYDAGVFIMI
jgi:hypothetical protein